MERGGESVLWGAQLWLGGSCYSPGVLASRGLW